MHPTNFSQSTSICLKKQPELLNIFLHFVVLDSLGLVITVFTALLCTKWM